MTTDELRAIAEAALPWAETWQGTPIDPGAALIVAMHPRRALAACDLADGITQEIKRLEQSNGLHQYDRGIHRMPGCGACDLLSRLRAVLARWEAL